MKEEKIIEICEEILASLSKMGYEKKGNTATERLIFPMKTETKKENKKQETENRISEQELRQLFIDKFKAKAYPDLYYSIETPTIAKYKFGEVDKEAEKGKELKNIKVDENGQSALLDMCIFKRIGGKYTRNLNIEFKHQNAPLKDIAKDVLKLMKEEQNGAFIFLLNNTNRGKSRGTLWNENNTGVFNKLSKSFSDFEKNWCGHDKSIHLIIMSLGQNTRIHRKIIKTDMDKLRYIFFEDSDFGNIKEIEGRGWVKV